MQKSVFYFLIIKQSFMNPEERKAAIATALGEASVAWSEQPTGTFDEAKAKEIGEKLYNELFPEDW